MSDIAIEQFDKWLQDDGPAALVFHRIFLPVEGKDSWIFPPTFAQNESGDDSEEGKGGDYQIDDLTDDPKRNVCLIDSVGSQANRMEPIFKKQPYAALVPQHLIEMKNGETVNLLDAGHRAADAAVRFSKILGPQLWSAFDLIKKKRDCSILAQLAPTSLVFGVWDSRATGVKIQRIVRSVIRAYNVKKAKRSATYQSAYDYTANELISTEHDKGTGKANPLSQEGFKYSLATGTHGGVKVEEEIRQEAIINLVALRTLTEDLNLKRYLLALALVALSYRDQQCFNLREGCLLRAATKDDFDGKWKSVNFDSTENPENISHETALAYAQSAIRNIGHSVFSTDEIKDWPKFVERLTQRADPVSAFLWQSLSNEEQKALTDLDPSGPTSTKAKIIVVQCLNKTIGKSSIHEIERFKDVDLRPETTDLIRKIPTCSNLAHLNRLLLEDAYPLELSRSQNQIAAPTTNEFDKETVEAWLKIEKKERKNLAKTMHPTKALARKQEKQAQEDAKNPMDAALKAIKAIKLGAKPKPDKPPKVQTEKFEALKKILDRVKDDTSAEEAIKTTAGEIVKLIQEDKDSHVLYEEVTKRLENFKNVQTAAANDQPTVPPDAAIPK